MIENNKEKFIELCKGNIHRDGIDELLEWLKGTDFFTAPASSKYHSSFEGGLCQHSLNVYSHLRNEVELTFGVQNLVSHLEWVTILALFHDFVKVNFYEKALRKAKDEWGNWIDVEYFKVNNKKRLYGHGVVSAKIISDFIKLTEDEYMAIVYHMGFSCDEARANANLIGEVFNNNIMAVLLSIADQKATFIDEAMK